MVRRSTLGPASGSRRAAPRPRGRRLLGSTAATAAASVVLALALAAIAPLASLPSAAAGAPSQCADSRELLASAPGLEGADPGHLIACVDEDHRRLTIHNRTPVVWAIGDPSVTGVIDQAGGVSGLLSSHASRSGRGLLLAPGASASVSAGPGRIAPRPDREATRLHLALTAIVDAQDAAEATLPPRAPRAVLRSAALTCAVALSGVASGWEIASVTALERAASTAGCARAWRAAGSRALADGWRLPALVAAVRDPDRLEHDRARARAAEGWFAAAGGYSWGSAERP